MSRGPRERRFGPSWLNPENLGIRGRGALLSRPDGHSLEIEVLAEREGQNFRVAEKLINTGKKLGFAKSLAGTLLDSQPSAVLATRRPNGKQESHTVKSSKD